MFSAGTGAFVGSRKSETSPQWRSIHYVQNSGMFQLPFEREASGAESVENECMSPGANV